MASAKQSAPMIYERLAAVMSEVPAIGKNRRNKQQGYSFRGIDDAYAALQPILAKHGIVPVPKVLEFTREERASKKGGVLVVTLARIQYTFFAPDGSSVEAVTLGEGMDSGDKSANKAMAGAQKYALLQVFCVPTEEAKDSENESPEPAPRAPKKASADKGAVVTRAIKALSDAKSMDEITNVRAFVQEHHADLWDKIQPAYGDAVERLNGEVPF